MARIHPTALVDAGARLADDVEVGPYSVVGPHVHDRRGHGRRSARRRSPAARRSARATASSSSRSIGEIPQDRKYGGEPTTHDDRRRQRVPRVRLDPRRHRAGPRRHARSATATGSSPTRTSRTIASSATTRRSRTTRRSPATSSSATGWCWARFAGVHQFCRVGAHAMVAAGAIVLQDVPPFVTVAGLPGQARRHQQRGAAPARLHGGGHRRGAPRVQDALPRGAVARGRARGAARPRRATPALAPLVAFLADSGPRHRPLSGAAMRDALPAATPSPSASSPARPPATRWRPR